MISNDKTAFLMQLILSSEESIFNLEEALEKEDQKKIKEIKNNLLKLNKAINQSLTELKAEIEIRT